MAKDLIRGKVAQIISERSLAINRGSDHGVKVGMRFVVLGPSAEIIDPETNEELGAIERHKVSVEVSQLSARFAICDTFSTGFDFTSVVAAGSLGNIFQTQPAPTLKSKDSSYVKPLTPDESYVAVGDDVREIPSASAAPTKPRSGKRPDDDSNDE